MFLTTGETRDCHAGYSKETLLRGMGGGRYRGMEKTHLRLTIISHLDIPDALILLVTSRIVHLSFCLFICILSPWCNFFLEGIETSSKKGLSLKCLSENGLCCLPKKCIYLVYQSPNLLQPHHQTCWDFNSS